MKSKQFIGIPLIVATLAFSFIAIDQVLSPILSPEGNSGFGWISFQAWAVYFLAGCDVKGGLKALLGYAIGVVMTILIFELAGIAGSLRFFAVPAAAFVVVTAVIFVEKLPPLDFIPAIFIGAGAMVCFLSYIDGATYLNASSIILMYCAIGLVYGYLTVLFRTAYEKRVSA